MIISMIGISQGAKANTLSDAFYTAFTDPKGFDTYLKSEILHHKDYLIAFEQCYFKAIQLLTIIERRENQRYSSCYHHRECYQAAKKIQSIKELRFNIEELFAYVKAATKNKELGFSNSSIGKVAFIRYHFHRKNLTDIKKNPAFRSQLSILSTIDER